MTASATCARTRPWGLSFQRLYESGRFTEVACWAHVRRKFFDVHLANGSAIACEALDKIGALMPSSRTTAAGRPSERERVRQACAGPPLAELGA
jgi:hypothetical protein